MFEFITWLITGHWQITLVTYAASIPVSYLLIRFALWMALRKDRELAIWDDKNRTQSGDLKFPYRYSQVGSHRIGYYFWWMFVPVLNAPFLFAVACMWYFIYNPLNYRKIFLLQSEETKS